MCNIILKFLALLRDNTGLCTLIGVIITMFYTIRLHYLSKEDNERMYNLSKSENENFYNLSKIEKQKDFLNSQLIELQRMSFYDSFVENEYYTKQWDTLKEQFIKKDNALDIDKFLKYDVYTEMIFNFIQMSLQIYKTEEELLQYIDFKSWMRTHAACWKNPLKEHSNREVYGKEMCDMIDDWLK